MKPPSLHCLSAAVLIGWMGLSHGAEIVVTNMDESGAGSLRQALADANPGDTIIFSQVLDGGTIILESGQLEVAKALSIDAGSLPSGIVLSRSSFEPRFRLMEITDSDDDTKLPVTITGLRFSGGSAPQGGAILNSENLTLTGCEFIGNRANGLFPDGRGGAILNRPASVATIDRCTFRDNYSRIQGGAIDNQSAELTIVGCRFIENSSLENAGAIFIRDASPALLNCSFLGNDSDAYGGAILNIEDSSPSFTNCMFVANRCSGESGGGSAVFNLDSSDPNFVNCSFAGNSVPSSGFGGTIFNSTSSPVLKNCILWGNDDGVRGSDPDPSSDFNLIEGSGGSSDPMFVREPGSLGDDDYGDLRLRAGSPALDAGDGDPETSMNDSGEDLEGTPRFVGPMIDLGAFEGGNSLNFAFFHEDLDPEGDANGNGLSNFVDYAMGGDPTAPADPSITPSITPTISGHQLSYGYRTDAEDVVPIMQKSTDLLEWGLLESGVDYSTLTFSAEGARTVVTVDLIIAPGERPRMFFRELFDEP